jgi:hypothetical protein
VSSGIVKWEIDVGIEPLKIVTRFKIRAKIQPWYQITGCMLNGCCGFDQGVCYFTVFIKILIVLLIL